MLIAQGKSNNFIRAPLACAETQTLQLSPQHYFLKVTTLPETIRNTFSTSLDFTRMHEGHIIHPRGTMLEGKIFRRLSWSPKV